MILTPTTVLDPTLYPEFRGNSKITEWRKELKRALLIRRDWVSDYSGLSVATDCEMHEGIITRGMVQGLKWRWMIFTEYNCLLLKHTEHQPQPPSKQWCVQWAFSTYGEDIVKEWFYSLPFKVYPFRI